MRTSGVLMHLTSLASPYGIGTMGAEARAFVDFLSDAGQTWWQVLPLGQTGFGDSPYQSFSTFAGNPYLIDLDVLAEQGLLERAEFAGLDWGADTEKVDYGLMYRQRFPVLALAARRLLGAPPEDYGSFLSENAHWLPDYALFMAIKNANGGRPWQDWPEPLRRRQPRAMDDAREEYWKDIEFWQAVQYLFFSQWRELKSYAGSKGVRFIGDLPIYVAEDSADAWSHPELFLTDGELRPRLVAGCPPDAFSADGQLWGNPVYDWRRMASDGYVWWIQRIRCQMKLCDRLRIDHFRGFDEFYAVPCGSRNARGGVWLPGPGLELFQAVEAALGPLDIIAEDLGVLTDSVRALLAATGFPGMKVLQFAFEGAAGESDYLPHNHVRNSVCYVGTHDNDTALGWLGSAPEPDRAFAAAYLRLGADEGPGWGLIRAAMASVADTAVVTAQDILELGSSGRMNRPSTLGGNWVWRARRGAFTPALARRLRELTALYGRLPKAGT